MFLDRFLFELSCKNTDTHTHTHTHTHTQTQRDSNEYSIVAFSKNATINNLSHNGLIPAHVPCWWVNNTALGEFCFTVIGRADREGSKAT